MKKIYLGLIIMIFCATNVLAQKRTSGTQESNGVHFIYEIWPYNGGVDKCEQVTYDLEYSGRDSYISFDLEISDGSKVVTVHDLQRRRNGEKNPFLQLHAPTRFAKINTVKFTNIVIKPVSSSPGTNKN